jgi:hypothetical protein
MVESYFELYHLSLEFHDELQVWALNESVEGSGKKVFKSWDLRLENITVG